MYIQGSAKLNAIFLRISKSYINILIDLFQTFKEEVNYNIKLIFYEYSMNKKKIAFEIYIYYYRILLISSHTIQKCVQRLTKS